MKSNIFLRVIISLMLFWANVEAKSQELSVAEAMDFANTKGKELLMAFQEEDLAVRYRGLDDIFLMHIDVGYVAKFVMGKYWRQMSEKQRQQYEEIFVRYGLAFYKTLPLEYAKNLEYEIVSASMDRGFVDVIANVRVKMGQEVQVITLTFRLHKVNGVIKVVDVKVAESSLLLSYRGKFYQMVAECDGEIEWFLEDLNDLAISMERNLQENVLNAVKTP